MFDRFFIRSFDAEDNLEIFIVAAVVSVLLIRLYLTITGFPIIGVGDFHIAHLLWGGLLMLLSIMILVTFLTQLSTKLAVIVGGVGFGAFIDEIGKFITRDNDYFYQPSIALIYISFVLLYLSVQSLDQLRGTSKKEYLINAVELLKEGLVGNLNKYQQRRALSYLRKADLDEKTHQSLTKIVTDVELVEVAPSWIMKVGHQIGELYRRLIAYRWFTRIVILIFIAKSLFSILSVSKLIDNWSELIFAVGVAMFMLAAIYESRQRKLSIYLGGLFVSLAASIYIILRHIPVNFSWPVLSFAEWGQLLSSAFAGLVVLVGIMQMRQSRLLAYQTFRVSVLISIFLTQFFSFYRDQFMALFTLFANLLVLAVLKYMIAEEYNRQTE